MSVRREIDMIYNYLEDRAQERNTVSDSTLREIVPPADSTTQGKQGVPINSGTTGNPGVTDLNEELPACTSPTGNPGVTDLNEALPACTSPTGNPGVTCMH